MKLIFSMIIVFISISAFAQIGNDLQRFEKIAIAEKVETPDYSKFKEQTGTFQVVLTQMFLFYKKFISSQDVSSCPFNPSCSVFMMNSIVKSGVFIGFLAGMDRYMRCNGKSNDRYQIEQDSHRLHDPAE